MGSEARARLGLAGLLAATLLSFVQLFAEGGYRGPAFLGTALAIAVCLGARRAGARTVLTAIASLSTLLVYLLVVFAGDKTFFGLPTPGAARALWEAVATALERSQIDYAPVPLRPGYVAMVVFGMWIAATAGELATFRWRKPLVASALPVGLFSANLVLGHGENAWLVVVIFLAALLTFWGLEASHRMRSWGRWVPVWREHAEEAPETLTGGLARAMGACSVVAALAAPLFLPALQEGLLTWRNDTGAGPGAGAGGVQIDPLVSVVPDLLEQSDEILMRVTSEEPGYWRLVTLEDFDGTKWTPRDTRRMELEPTGAVFALEEPPPERARLVSQTYSIASLGGENLPTLGRPHHVQISAGDRSLLDVSVHARTTDLYVAGGLDEGLTYTLQSILPDASYADLRKAEASYPGASGSFYADLPQGTAKLPPEVYELASEWTIGAETDFDVALAIQEHLRDTSEFTYSTDPMRSENTTSHLASFLTETKQGYCQQFVTAFAALARIKQLPTRIAVGFLQGEQSPTDPTQFTVRGTHAHAWPEVYFQDYGWVRFEPTPRADGVEQVPGYTTGPTAVAGFGPGGRRGGDDSLRRGALGEDFSFAGEGETFQERFHATAPVAAPRPRRAAEWEARFRRIGTAALVLLAGFGLSIPFLKELRTSRRYARATDDDARAVAAFAQFEDEAAELVGPRRASESAIAYAERISGLRAIPESPTKRLARIYEAAEYGGRPIPPGQAVEARGLARDLRSRLWKTSPWWNRALRLFSPGRLGIARPRLRPARAVTALLGRS